MPRLKSALTLELDSGEHRLRGAARRGGGHVRHVFARYRIAQSLGLAPAVPARHPDRTSGLLHSQPHGRNAAYSAVSEEAKAKSPLKEVLADFPRETFASFSMVILWTVCTYVLLFYMPTYSVRTLHLPQSTGFIAGMMGGLMIMCFSPVIGKLADAYGRRIFLSGAALAILLIAYPMFAWINHAPGLGSLLVFQAGLRRADRSLHGSDSRRILRAVPDQGAFDRPLGRLQLRRDDLRRLRAVLHYVAHRVNRQQHGARVLRDDRRGHQSCRHVLCEGREAHEAHVSFDSIRNHAMTITVIQGGNVLDLVRGSCSIIIMS